MTLSFLKMPPSPYLFLAAIEVFAPGVTVTGIELDGSIDTGLLVNGSAGLATDKPIIIESNKQHAAWTSLRVFEPNLFPYYGMYVIENSGSVSITWNTIRSDGMGEGIHNCWGPGETVISDNDIQGGARGINVHHNGVGGYVGPVTVTRNTIVPPSIVDFFSAQTRNIYGYQNQCPLIITENVFTAVLDQPLPQAASRDESWSM